MALGGHARELHSAMTTTAELHGEGRRVVGFYLCLCAVGAKALGDERRQCTGGTRRRPKPPLKQIDHVRAEIAQHAAAALRQRRFPTRQSIRVQP